ncbi:MAG: hypothetical protein ABJN04_11200 [Hyphomicrobiales bacterium]
MAESVITVGLGLIDAVLTSKNFHGLIQGEKTHDIGMAAVNEVLPFTQEIEFHVALAQASVPENYSGNLISEVSGFVKSGVEKGIHKRSLDVVTPYEPGKEGPIPMGYHSDSRFVIFDQIRHLLHVEPSNRLMQLGTLMNLAPSRVLMEKFPKFVNGKVDDVDCRYAADVLMNLCRDIGGFDVSKVRGRGVFKEDGEVVVNFGGPLPNNLKYTYVCPLNLDIIVDGLEEVDAEKVLSTFRLFNWQNPSLPFLLLGWAALAPICGVLDWRPHIFITGSKNTGKSTLILILERLFGEIGIVLDGASTEAGIRQKIGADSRPVVLDEFEADTNINRMKGIIKLIRSASSATGQIAKGTPEGRALEFNLNCAFLLAAITPMAISAADRSRIVILPLNKHENDPEIAQKIAKASESFKDIAPKWCGTSVAQIDNILASIPIIKSMMPSCDSRHNTNISTLLAGAWCVLNRATITEQTAKVLIDEHITVITELGEVHEGDDATDCLNALLQFRAENNFSLGNLLAYLKRVKGGRDDDRAGLLRKVEMFGIKQDQNGFLIANTHRGLSEVFKGTIWEAGGWSNSLQRLEGVEKTKQKRFSGGKRVEAIFLPASLIPEDYDDGHTLPPF